MGRTGILNREQPAATFYGGMAIEKKQQPSLEELRREVEVLRGKLQSLRMAHDRVEREAQRLTELLQAVRGTAKVKMGVA
jgi:chaperonin cofactor prefoldin